MSGSGPDRGDELEPPGRALEVEPTPLRASGGGQRRGLVVLASVAIAVAAAVGLAQIDAPGPRPVARDGGVLATPTVERSADPTLGPPTVLPRVLRVPTTLAIPARVRPVDLADAVADGSLDGRLVFVDGAMEVTPVRCVSLKQGRHGCVDLNVPGLGVKLRTGDDVRPWPGDPPAGAWLVTVAQAGGLVYLGALLPDRERVAGITALEAKLATRGGKAAGTGSLFEVDGSLVPLPRRSCPEGCSAASPFLVDKLASVSELLSTSGIPVVVDAGSPDVDPGAAIVQGTFLVARTADGTRWRIVARYDPTRSLRVLAP